MRRLIRPVLVLLAVCAVAVAAVLISFAVLLNGSGLRTRVEEALSRGLGRPVTIERLELSPWTGSAIAEDLRIAEDPAFGAEPFVHAARVRIGIEVLPLLLRRQVRIGSIALEEPAIRLLRNGAGTWNFASLSHHRPAAAGAAPHALPDLAISSLAVEDGHLLVHMEPAAGTTNDARELRFDRLQFGVRHFDLARPFAFDLSTALPPAGTLAVTGTAGPWNTADAASTPASAHLHLRQLDLEAAGLVARQAVSGVSGRFADIVFDLAWQNGTLHVTNLVLESPQLTIGGKTRATATPAGAPQKPSVWTSVLRRLSVAEGTVHHGNFTLIRQDGRPAVFRNVELQETNWSATTWSAFTASALYGSAATLRASGRFRVPLAGPAEPPQPAAFDAHLSANHLDLASSGLLAPGSPFSGIVESDTELQLSAGVLRASGTARVERLKLARTGQPYARPVLASFSLSQRSAEGSTTGTIEHAAFTLGPGATVAASGTYHVTGPAAVLDLRTSANALPIDQIEAFLPTVGVQLPEGSRLTGGTVTTALTVTGSAANLTIAGPVRLESTRLMGFDLGSKLSSLARFTGGRLGSSASPGTQIRSLSLDLRSAGGEIVTDHITADIAGIGVATGSGTVGQGATLHYGLSLKLNELISGPNGGEGLARNLAGLLPPDWAARALGAIDYLAKGPMKNGIPILIGGTAKHPTVTPNLGALLPPERPRR